MDKISSLTLNLSASQYAGAISSTGYAAVSLDADSTWTLTGDSFISEFTGDLDRVNANGHSLYVAGRKIL